MTINEKRQLSNYIKNLVRESLGEMDSMPSWWNDKYGSTMDLNDDEGLEGGHYDDDIEGFPDEHNDFWEEMGKSQPGRHYEGPDVDGNDDPVYSDEEDDDEPAGLDELRQLAESYARESVAQILSEKRGGWKNKGKKSKKGKKGNPKKTGSDEKSIMDRLNSDSVNAAHYFYKLYGVENGTEAEKASARSKGYKKSKGKAMPGKHGYYRFNSKERNKLNAMLTTDKN